MEENKKNAAEINEEQLDQASGGMTFNIRCRHCGYTATQFNSRIENQELYGHMVPKAIPVCPSCGKDA